MTGTSLLEALLAGLSQAGFRLGGSRRMAEKYPDQIIISEETDWDFYGGDTPENRSFLTTNGFRKVEAKQRDYWDSLLLDIYKHTEFPIEVLIRSDVDLYSCAFESITPHDFINKLWKSSPLRDKNECLNEFKGKVCGYFNRLFHQHRPKVATDLPF